MTEDITRGQFWQAPEGAIGGDGPLTDQTILAPRTDAEIEQGIHEALVLDPDVDAGRFTARVEHGVVELIGRTRTPDEHRSAVHAASTVHGVRRIVDQITDL